MNEIIKFLKNCQMKWSKTQNITINLIKKKIENLEKNINKNTDNKEIELLYKQLHYQQEQKIQEKINKYKYKTGNSTKLPNKFITNYLKKETSSQYILLWEENNKTLTNIKEINKAVET